MPFKFKSGSFFKFLSVLKWIESLRGFSFRFALEYDFSTYCCNTNGKT